MSFNSIYNLKPKNDLAMDNPTDNGGGAGDPQDKKHNDKEFIAEPM